MTLQAIICLVLAGSAAILYGAGTFSRSLISDQLTAQKISFPPASAAVTGGALDPKEFPSLQQYAGQAVDNGPKAEAYANNFIGTHLTKIAGGLTYSQASAKAIADPKNTVLADQVATLFRGETLRGLLLNAYGWWTIGTYALYGAYAIALAALFVLLALVFEVTQTVKVRSVISNKTLKGVPATA
jgi:hypothetical protein